MTYFPIRNYDWPLTCYTSVHNYIDTYAGYKTDHRAVLAFTDQCTSGGTGPYILGRPVKFSHSQDADNLHTIRKRMPIPFQ